MSINEYVSMAENVVCELNNFMHNFQGIGHAMKLSGTKINRQVAYAVARKSLRMIKAKKIKIKRKFRYETNGRKKKGQ